MLIIWHQRLCLVPFLWRCRWSRLCRILLCFWLGDNRRELLEGRGVPSLQAILLLKFQYRGLGLSWLRSARRGSLGPPWSRSRRVRRNGGACPWRLGRIAAMLWYILLFMSLFTRSIRPLRTWTADSLRIRTLSTCCHRCQSCRSRRTSSEPNCLSSDSCDSLP